MTYEKIMLDETKDDVLLEVYCSKSPSTYRRKAILVIPGGAYKNVCWEREGEPVALAFMPHGYNAFVLHYSVDRKRVYPEQLIEASLAMKFIRDNAEKYNIDPENIFVTGFSAGGHLTCMLGTMWHRKEVYDRIDMPYGYNKPKGMMPIYPVVTSMLPDSDIHFSSFQNLTGNDEVSEEMREYLSIEKNVDEKSVPAFIMHTATDDCVPVKNALVLAEAYAEHGRSFELHIFRKAQHGCALGNKITQCGEADFDNPAIAQWVNAAVYWAEHLDD